MSRLILLTKAEQQKFDSSPQLTKAQRQKFFALTDDIEDYLTNIRKPVNKVGFLIQLGYFRASEKFFLHEAIKEQDAIFACELVNLSPQELDLSLESYTIRDKALHRKVILDMLGWKPFTKKVMVELKKELIIIARQQLHPKSLFPMAIQFLINRNIELPPYYVLANIISDAYNKAEDSLVDVVDKVLSPYQKEILNDIIIIDDIKRPHYKYSCLAKIKQMPLSIKLTNILDSIETFKLIKEFYNIFSKTYEALNLSESATQYYATWVQKSKLFQLKQFKHKAKAYLYLLAYMKHQYYIRNDLYIDIILKAVNIALNKIKRKREKQKLRLLQAQKEALYGVIDILNNDKISSDDKVAKSKSILEGFIKSKNTLSKEDKKHMESLIHNDAIKANGRTHELKAMASSLNRKLAPIICIIEFDEIDSNKNILKAIKRFSKPVRKWYDKSWLTEEEISMTFNPVNDKPTTLIYRGLLFTKIFDYLKAGKLNLMLSYRYLPIEKYLIDDQRWVNDKSLIISSNGLERFSYLYKVINELKAIYDFTAANDEKYNFGFDIEKICKLKIA